MIWILLPLIFTTSWVLPWWGFLLCSYLIGWKTKNPIQAFSAGFLATSLAFTMTAYYHDLKAEGLISRRLSEMIAPSSPSPTVYVALIVLFGLLSGLFSLAGYYGSLYRKELRSRIQLQVKE